MTTLNRGHCDSVREEFIQVRNVKTNVLKVGHFRERLPTDAKQVLMLIIPGNPGVPYFYEDFMQELYSHCDGQVPVWTIGHAGHVRPPGAQLKASDIYATDEDIFGLEAQIKHKVDFIKDNIPPDVSLILIGHSIGCYMILNLLDQLPSKQVLRCFMLFPTIEHMAQSPNGVKMAPVLRHLRWLVVFIAFLFYLIPDIVKCQLIRWWYKNVDYPSCMEKAVLATSTPWTANFTTYLAKIEMNKVTTLQRDLINKHSGQLSFYYGSSDHWAPVKYYHNLIAEFPKLDARLCTLNLKHAFVLDSQEGREMAKIVWLWAQSHHHTVLSSQNLDDGETWVFNES